MDWRDGGVAYGAEECCLARRASQRKARRQENKDGGINSPLQDKPRALETGCYKNKHQSRRINFPGRWRAFWLAGSWVQCPIFRRRGFCSNDIREERFR